MTLEAFEQMLDAFGGDPARWPEKLCAGAQSLLVQSEPARRYLRETQALDQLLEKAGATDRARVDRLAGAIVNKALAEPRRAVITGLPHVPATGQVIRLAAPKRPAASLEVERRAVPVGKSQRSQSSTFYRVAAAMAASLLFGIAIGFTDLAPSTSLLGLSTATDTTSSEADVAILSLHTDSLDEEQL
ncbi:MAG: hypothetical protein JSS20_15090 [Proteobacteria bacterium]|nr:hypothetical protein [Pseudomonadota bacterium]